MQIKKVIEENKYETYSIQTNMGLKARDSVEIEEGSALQIKLVATYSNHKKSHYIRNAKYVANNTNVSVSDGVIRAIGTSGSKSTITITVPGFTHKLLCDVNIIAKKSKGDIFIKRLNIGVPKPNILIMKAGIPVDLQVKALYSDGTDGVIDTSKAQSVKWMIDNDLITNIHNSKNPFTINS